MNRLRIEDGIRHVIGRLWDHNYQTFSSCSGHGTHKGFVLLREGDGWFEKNARDYGLNVQPNSECCTKQSLAVLDEIKQFGFDPKEYKDPSKVCTSCGAGVNGYMVYTGFLQTPIY